MKSSLFMRYELYCIKVYRKLHSKVLLGMKEIAVVVHALPDKKHMQSPAGKAAENLA